LALREGRRLAEFDGIRTFIAAAVDTLVRRVTINAYLEQSRVLTPGNSNGFAPAEGAGAILVTASGNVPGLEVLGIGLARENATIESEEPFRAEGMTQAVRLCLEEAGIGMEDVSYRITDLNGERYKFKEATITFSRLLTKSATRDIGIWHPIDCVGEVGAAIGPLAFALALHASEHGYAPGDTALLHFSNDGGERAAVVTRFVNGA